VEVAQVVPVAVGRAVVAVIKRRLAVVHRVGWAGRRAVRLQMVQWQPADAARVVCSRCCRIHYSS
jgi:hypothetical protein